MQIIDTHSHIYDESFDLDIEAAIQRAKDAGVEKILLPNVDTESIERVHHLAEAYPHYCIPMMGLHPTSVKEDWREQLHTIKKQFDNHQYIAVGEIGIDLYWDKTFIKEQQQAFEEQLQWSIDYNLPVAIHTREATNEAISCINNVGANKLRGVFHSFVGTEEELKDVMSLENFFIGINGVITYKNSTLRDVLQKADLSRIIIETDSPYLTPVPFRGKRNESSYTVYVVNELAKVFNLPSEEIGRITTQNAVRLFNLK